MPFLLLDDATDFLGQRLQDFGNTVLQPLQQQSVTQRLQDYGSSLLPQPQSANFLAVPPQIDPNDITQRLQDFGGQHLQNALSSVQQAPQLLPSAEQVFGAIPQPQTSDGLPETISGLPAPDDQAVQDRLDRVDAAIQAVRHAQVGDMLLGYLQPVGDLIGQQNQLAREGRAQYGLPEDQLLAPIDVSRPGQSFGIDPYQQIVEEGVPAIVRGVQTGNAGDIVGGAVQTLLGAASALPGTGGGASGAAGPTSGAARAVVEEAAPGVQTPSALRDFLTSEAGNLSPPDVGQGVSRVGSLVASALGPVENLPSDTAGALRSYANMVGRQSDAARVIAENEMRTAGADLRIPAVADEVQQRVYELRDQAARQLVDDLQAQGKAAPVGSQPRAFRLVTDDPSSALSDYAFSPDVVGPIKAVTDTSAIAANPLGRALLTGVGALKGTLFSLSNFHTLTEGLNAAFSGPETLNNFARAFVSDSFAQGLRGSMADTIDAAARAGVTGLAQRPYLEDVGPALASRLAAAGIGGVGGGAAGYTETKLTGGSDEEAWGNALKLGALGAGLAGIPIGSRGTLAEIQRSALFDRAVPLAKATTWDGLVKGGLDPQVAANVVNERFGGLNYAAMGRSPALLDAQRLVIMASDWNESTLRQLGSAIFGGSGQGVRAAFLGKTLAGMLSATEVANYALSGHSTLANQPGHLFDVEVPNPSGGYLHFGILPGNVQAYLNAANVLPQKGAAEPLNFVAGRLSQPMQLAGELKDTLGGHPPPWVAKGGAAGLLENFAPVGVSQVAQSTLQGGLSPVAAAGLAVGGLNPRYSGASSGFSAPTTTTRTARSHVAHPAATTHRAGGYTSGGRQSGELQDVLDRLQALLAEALRSGRRDDAAQLQAQIDQVQQQLQG